jgi:KH domain
MCDVYRDCPDGTVQLMLLANDDYCGMLIGRDGRSLRQMREDSDARISFAKYVMLSNDFTCLVFF